MKRSWKNILLKVLIALFFGGFLTLTAFSGTYSILRPSPDLNVIIDHKDGHSFILQKDVEQKVKEHFMEVKVVDAAELRRLERYLESVPYILDANAYVDSKGKLNVSIVQRNPIARVLSGTEGHFYIDDNGYKFPLSKQYTAKVPLITGDIQETYQKVDTITTRTLKEALEVIRFTQKDAYWSALVTQVHHEKNGKFIIIPRMGNHTITLGDAQNLENKFNRLELFYKYVLTEAGWDKYSNISLQYKNQIVCK